MIRKYYILITIFSLSTIGCEVDEFLKEDPRDSIYADNLFENYSGFYSGLNSVYSMIRQVKGAGDRMSRDMVWAMNTDVVSTRYNTINDFSEITPTFQELNDVYNWLYQLINTTNMIIDRAEGDVDWEGQNEEENLGNKNAIIAQARVARAWAYRLLIYAFGPVPLNTSEVNGSNYSNGWNRNSVEEIKAQMLEDLEFATADGVLPLKGADDTRISGAVAHHYLGELYLSLGEFQKAVDILRPLCESNQFQLINTRFGRLKDDLDGNYFMDMIRNPFANSGNTETFFVFANGLELPGGDKLSINDAYINEYRKFSKIEQTAEWYQRYGGFGKGRYLMTAWSMFDKESYNLYNRNKGDDDNIIEAWLWENKDGRDNFLYEMNDIRGQNEAIRRFFVYDWNENGTLTDPSTYPLDRTIQSGEPRYNDSRNEGDTLYTHYIYEPDNLGYPGTSSKYAYHYSRKWEIDETHTLDFTRRETAYPDIGYLRIAETYLLYAEAHLMLGNKEEAAEWINKIRTRAQASEINPNAITLDFILDERARELVAEEERRITLLRTGKYLERVRAYNALSSFYIKNHHKLYPFPAAAIDANKDNPLEQNQGYGGSITVDFTPPGYIDEG